MPSTLICTPCYGGMLSMQYAQSLLTETFNAPERLQTLVQRHQLHTAIDAVESGQVKGMSATQVTKYISDTKKLLQALPDYDIGHFFLGHESLISRGRNTCALMALEKGVDYLLFIDADSRWRWGDIKKILDSQSPIVAALVPFKQYPLQLNFHPYKVDEPLIESHGGKNVRAVKALAAQYQNPEIDVAFIGTAFMRISTQVFRDLIKEGCPKYLHAFHGEVKTFYDFFPVGPQDEQYLSEDWGFCSLAKSVGYKIKAHSGVFIGHVGSHLYQAGVTPQVT